MICIRYYFEPIHNDAVDHAVVGQLYMICIRYYFEPIHNMVTSAWHSTGLYMICIRYYFEPIHNRQRQVRGICLVVYDMYKILF